jgi:proline iminopeptidase
MDMKKTEGYIEVEDGLRLYYCTAGDGSAVVVITGATWNAVDLEPLAQGRTLIFYDPRGRGQSDAVTDPARLGLDYELHDLEVIRRHFGLERMLLIGHSTHGALVALYAAQRPDRVSRLLMACLISPRRNPYFDQMGAEFNWRLDPAGLKRLEEMRRAGLNTSDPVAFCRASNEVLLPAFFYDPSKVSRLRRDPCACSNEWPDNFVGTFGQLMLSLGDWDWRAEMASLEVPTLVVHGMGDFVPLEASREWAATLPNARLVVMAEAGHMPWAEQPDVFFAAADTFLSGEWSEGAEIIRLATT